MSMTLPPPPPMGDEEDTISATPNSPALLGHTLDYLYSTGRHYQLAFDREYNVRFAWVNHPVYPGEEEFIAPNLPYRSREIRPGLINIHWIVKPPSIHVSISVDLTERRLYTACMMPPNKWEFWDEADILEIVKS